MKRLSALTASIAIIATSAGISHAADESETSLQAALSRQVPQWLQEHNVPSVAVAYIENGAIAWTAAYGQQAPGEPATAETVYNVASLAKPLVAETAMRLIAKGETSLDDPISPVWVDPDVAGNPWHRKLTPEITLTHQVGFLNWRYQTEDTLQFEWEPGTKTGYSGEGYEYLARFLQLKTGTPFQTLLRNEVIAPLDLNDTGFVRQDRLESRIAMSYGPEGEWGEADTSLPWSGADNLYTTVEDYADFMIAVMTNEGMTPELAATRFDIRQDQIALTGCPLPAEYCPSAVGFGLGWEVFEYERETVVHHGGSDWGEKTLAVFNPETRSGIVIFTNGANGDKMISEVAGLLWADSLFTKFLAFKAG